MLVGGVSARKCDVPSLGMSPVGLGKSCSSSAFPDAEGILRCSCPGSGGVRGASTLCICLAPSRTISGLGGSMKSLLFGGTVPLLDVSGSIKNNNMVAVGFFFLGADCSEAVE